MFVFVPVFLIVLLLGTVLYEMKRGRDTNTKLDELEAVLKRIEGKMVCTEVYDHTPPGCEPGGDKVPASKPERFHTIEDVGMQKEK